MTSTAPIKLFQFPRMFAVPNLSPFCCKQETFPELVSAHNGVVQRSAGQLAAGAA